MAMHPINSNQEDRSMSMVITVASSSPLLGPNDLGLKTGMVNKKSNVLEIKPSASVTREALPFFPSMPGSYKCISKSTNVLTSHIF
jgi:hypothetical protein